MATTVWSCVSGLSAVFAASGSLTATPFCSIGAMSIMMMSSTSMTSTSGVTLMSDLRPPLSRQDPLPWQILPMCRASTEAIGYAGSDAYARYAVFLMK